MTPIDIKHLHYFVGVAHELHFGRAATRLGISQPALSQQIGALEAILGVQLLIRDRRSVVLTEAGLAFQAQAVLILHQVERMVDITRRTSLKNEQRVTIAMVEYTDLPFIVPAVAELRKLYPNVKVSRREMVSTEQIKALKNLQIDIGVGVLLAGEDNVANIVARPALKGNWVLAVPADHRFAAMETLDLCSLARESLIFFERNVNAPLYDAVVESFQKVGMEPNFFYETTQAQVGLRMVTQSDGLMLGADYLLRQHHDGITYVPIEGLPDLHVHIFFRDNESSGLVSDFVELLAEAAARS